MIYFDVAIQWGMRKLKRVKVVLTLKYVHKSWRDSTIYSITISDAYNLPHYYESTTKKL